MNKRTYFLGSGVIVKIIEKIKKELKIVVVVGPVETVEN